VPGNPAMMTITEYAFRLDVGLRLLGKKLPV